PHPDHTFVQPVEGNLKLPPLLLDYCAYANAKARIDRWLVANDEIVEAGHAIAQLAMYGQAREFYIRSPRRGMIASLSGAAHDAKGEITREPLLSVVYYPTDSPAIDAAADLVKFSRSGLGRSIEILKSREKKWKLPMLIAGAIGTFTLFALFDSGF